jgi:hypothetical protein
MNTMRAFGCFAVITAILLALPAAPALADPPVSANIAGVENVGWEYGMCHTASFGELLQQKNPSITPASVVARSGEAVQAAWMRTDGTYRLFTHPRWLAAPAVTETAVFSGVGFHLCYGLGRGAGPEERKTADSVTTFKTEAEAILKLKEVIAAGSPVQVHTDMYYLNPGSYSHGHHRIVIHGYDAANVYYTDNGGADHANENVALPWADFLLAWNQAPLLNPRFPPRPYMMIYLSGDPAPADDVWMLCRLALDAFEGTPRVVTGPDALRAAANALRDGVDPSVVFSAMTPGDFLHRHGYFIDYLTEAGQAALAADWQDACDLWQEMDDGGFDWNNGADRLDQIADIEEGVLTVLAALEGALDPICAMTPADGANLATLEDCAFRWATLPGVGNTVLQFAMTGDFSDRRNCQLLRPRPGKCFVATTWREWLRVLRKDGGDESLTWRVTGLGRNASLMSAENGLNWDEMLFESHDPIDGYTVAAEDELVTFEWTAPFLAKRPRVVLSADGDFDNPRTRLYLTARPGESQTAFRRNTIRILRRKDDDGVIYWRVEDAAWKLTTVQPSATRTLNLP